MYNAKNRNYLHKGPCGRSNYFHICQRYLNMVHIEFSFIQATGGSRYMSVSNAIIVSQSFGFIRFGYRMKTALAKANSLLLKKAS